MMNTNSINLDLTCFEAYQKQKSSLVPSHFTRLALFEHSVEQISRRIDEADVSEKSTTELFDIFMDLILALDEGTKNFEDVKNYQALLFAFIHQAESSSIVCRKKAQNCFRNFLKLFDYEAQSKLIIQLIAQIRDDILKVEMEPQVLSFLIDIYRQKFNECEESRENFEKNLPDLYVQIESFKYPNLNEATQFYSSVVLLIRLQAIQNIGLLLLKNNGKTMFKQINTLVVDYIHLIELSKKSQNSNEQDLHEMFPLELLKMHIVETGRLLNSIK